MTDPAPPTRPSFFRRLWDAIRPPLPSPPDPHSQCVNLYPPHLDGISIAPTPPPGPILIPCETALHRLSRIRSHRSFVWWGLLKNWPGWTISILFHACLIVLMLLLIVQIPADSHRFVIIQTSDDLLRTLTDQPLEELFKQNPVESELDDIPAVDADRPLPASGYTDLVDPGPPDFATVAGRLVGAGDGAGGGDHLSGKLWGNSPTGLLGDRSQAGRRDGVRLRGGSAASEKAVEAALDWLALHQDRDGKWDYVGFVDHCPADDPCGGAGVSRHASLPGGPNISVTALSFLAFLAAGNTHLEGPRRDTAAKALNWLLAQQNEYSGAFNSGQTRTSIYNQAIATLALAECYTMTKDPKLRTRLIRAIGFLNQCQQPQGGWDYLDIRTGRNDTSVTGWVVMAYKSTRAAGIDVPPRVLSGLRRHFDRVTNDRGYTGYTEPTSSSRLMALNAVGMLSSLYLGADRSHPLVAKQAALLLDDLPSWISLSGANGRNHSMYYWYYGTLAMYQIGGKEWALWNSVTRDMLVANQCTHGHRAGSWDPDDYWSANYAGRVFSTAICVLDIEIYYRYLPLYQQQALPVELALADAIDKEPDPANRIKLLRRMLSLSQPDVQDTLVKLLNDPDPSVRFASAKELAERNDPAAIPFLVQSLDSPDNFTRFGAIRALGRIDDPRTIPLLIRALSDPLPGNAELAAESLRVRTGQNFPFKATFTSDQKSRTIAAWKAWWDANGQALADEPPVVARMLASRDGGERVLLRLVSGGPLKTGMRLTVYRAGELAGYLRVEQVMEGGMAEASTLKWLLAKPIQPEDQLRNSAALRKENAS